MNTKELIPAYEVGLVVDKVRGKTRHFYDVGGVRYGGVTGVLGIINKPALVNWAARQAADHIAKAIRLSIGSNIVITDEWIKVVLDAAKKRPEELKTEAADKGTLIHKRIDQDILCGPVDPLTPELAPAYEAFQKWVKESQIRFLMGDTKVASIEFGYGGSLDALGQIGDDLVLLDWKTSSGIWPEYALQVAAYAQAFKETYGETIDKAYIVRFSKKLPVEFEVKEIKSLDDSFEAFLAAKKLRDCLAEDQFAN